MLVLNWSAHEQQVLSCFAKGRAPSFMVAAPQPALNRADWAAMPSGHRMDYLNKEMATVLGREEDEDQHEMGVQPEQEMEDSPIRTAEPQTSRPPPAPPPPPPHLWVPDACKTPWTQQDDQKLLEVPAPPRPPTHPHTHTHT